MKKLISVGYLSLVFLLLSSGAYAQETPSFGSLYASYKVPKGYVEDVAVKGDYAYLAAKSGGLHVIHWPTGTWIHHIPTQGESWALEQNGSYLFLADRLGGGVIFHIDLVGPSQGPLLVSRLNPGFSVDSIGVDQGQSTLVLAGARGQMQVYNIQDIHSPLPLGTFVVSSEKNLSAVALLGSYVFAGDADGRLIPIDFSDPGKPKEGTLYRSSTRAGRDAWALGIHLDEGRKVLSFSNWGAGFIQLDISDPMEPREIGRFSTEDGVYDSLVRGERAYLANGWGGVAVLDLSQEGNIQLVGGEYLKPTLLDGGIRKGIKPHGVDFQEGKLFLANNSAHSLTILNIEENF